MTVVSRISTYAAHQGTLADVNKKRADLMTLQRQISSGLKADNFVGLLGQVERFINLEAKMGKAQRYMENNEVVISRMRTMNVALDTIIHAADQFQDLLTLRRKGAVGANIGFKEQAIAIMQNIAGQLNTNAEGRYLFAGGKTTTEPVITPVPNPLTLGTPDDSYYQGDDLDISVRAMDNFEMNYNVRANEEPFQKLFAAIFRGMEGDQDPDLELSDDKIAEAIDMVNEAIQGVITIQARVNANIVNLEDINDRHNALKLYWKGVTEGVANTDLIEASTMVAQDEATLQATFQAFARINNLQLSDYL